MFPRRFYLALAAVLVLGGCASSGYDDYYDRYPNEAYGYDPYGPYYGPYGYSPYGYGAFGYGSVFDNGFHRRSHRFFHPDDDVTCDRARDVCYDRHGPSFKATKRFLGEREAKDAFRHRDNRRFLNDQERMERMLPRKPGSIPDDDTWWFRRHSRAHSQFDDDEDRVVSRPDRSRPRDMVDNDRDDDLRRLRPEHSDRPIVMDPLHRDNDHSSGQGGCPPRGCSKK